MLRRRRRRHRDLVQALMISTHGLINVQMFELAMIDPDDHDDQRMGRQAPADQSQNPSSAEQGPATMSWEKTSRRNAPGPMRRRTQGTSIVVFEEPHFRLRRCRGSDLATCVNDSVSFVVPAWIP